ncbi:MAG: glycosyltransferase family 4 protein [Anaerolineales bacterium]
MTIYVDVSSAVHAKAGLKRYAENLVRELEQPLGGRLHLFQNSLGRRGPLAGWEEHPTVGVRHGYKMWRALVLARQVVHWPMDDLLPDASLFHATEHLLPPLRRIPTVLTVHDLIFERYPKYHKIKNYLYLQAAMPLYCRRATAIIAVSESTREDIIDLYHIPPKKITVIPEAADPNFCPQPAETIEAVRSRYDLPPRYLLAVGTIEPRKNLSRLADASGPLFDQDLVDALVLVGSKGWLYEDFFRHLETLPWQDRILLTGFVEEEDLPAVYAGALLMVQPSLYEGFGLPVLEAMACGCPVCASNTSSLPEVGGEAARYFDPRDTEGIIHCIGHVLRHPHLHQEMVAKGLARAKAYSWKRTARQTLNLYQRLIDGSI